ncbi:MAG: 30S ribosomal protein S9 [Myxococcota bacterium]
MAIETQIMATGRRKRAVARVILRPGKGEIKINDQNLNDYFPRETSRIIIRQPFLITNTLSELDAIVNARGGGKSGQAEAVRAGISRALIKYKPELRPILKKAGFLTRDAREVERKKYGRKKARKRFQYSKR